MTTFRLEVDNAPAVDPRLAVKIEVRSITRTVGGRVKADIWIEGVDYIEFQYPGQKVAKFVELDGK